MGPDRCSSLTTTNYYVQSVATGRFFFTDDVVQPTSTPDPVDPPGEPQAFLPERDGPVPPILDSVRGKTAVPAIRSMLDIEGEARACENVHPQNLFQIPGYLQSHVEMDDINGSNTSSWTLSTDPDQTSASSQADTPTTQSDAEFGGGDVEEAPNDRASGAYPVASNMTGSAALRCLHSNLGEYIKSEYEKMDATSEDQAMWIGVLVDTVRLKSMVEHQLQDAQRCEAQRTLEKLDQEFFGHQDGCHRSRRSSTNW